MFFKRLITKYNAYKFVKNLHKKLTDEAFEFEEDAPKTIGCIVDENWCETDFLKDRIAKVFNVNRTKVSLLIVDSHKDEDFANAVALKALKPDFNSRLDHPELNFFLDQPYRILLQLYTLDDRKLKWISAHTKASFRIGLGINDPRLSDLIINMDTYSCDKVLKEIEKYTSRLDVLKDE